MPDTWFVSFVAASDKPTTLAGQEATLEEVGALLSALETGEKDGYALIPARFEDCPGRCRNPGLVDCGGDHAHRLGDNVRAVTMLGLDFDEACQERPNPPFFHWFYETHGSTEAHRKWRLLFPFAEDFPVYTPADWRDRAWPALVKHLGVAGHPGIDTSCADPARLYYLPRHPAGETRLVGEGGPFNAPLLDWTAVLPAPLPREERVDTTPAPPPIYTGPVDIALLRERLAGVYRNAGTTSICKLLLSGKPLASVGKRHEMWQKVCGALSLIAVELYGPDVDPDALWEIFRPSYEAGVAADTDTFDRAEIEAILNHSLRTAPAKIAERNASRVAALKAVERLTPHSKTVAAPDKTPPGAPPVDIGVYFTDTWLAEKVVAVHGEDLKHVGAWDSWLAWDGRRWATDDTHELQRKVRETVRAIHIEAAQHGNKEMAAFCVQALSAAKRRAAAELAGYERAVALSYALLDQKPDLLNVQNGTVDLKTGELRPHRREDLLTKCASAAYDATAECPVWLAFLDRIMARDSTLIGFLQRAIGYSLTGSVSEQVLFFLHGTGANGKSTLTTVLLQLLGDYGRQAAPGLLMAKKGEAHPTAEADLFGARLVVSQEIDQNRLLAEGTVKQLTGGDRMKVRRMREDFWEFTPTHKIWLSANHKPIVHGVDHAIWRRILLLPFAVTIPKDEWDLKLAEKLTAELPGIFAWAVRGCLAWRERGLDPPARVSAATQAYRTEMDSLGEFIAERCLIDPKATSPRSALFTAYKDWAEKAGYSKPLTSIGFGRQIGERPEVAGGASHGGRYWCGIRPWTALELATRMKAEGEAAAAEIAERVRKRAEEAGLTAVQGGLK